MEQARIVIRPQRLRSKDTEGSSAPKPFLWLALFAVVFVQWVYGADVPPPPSHATAPLPAAKIEIKLLVPADKVVVATKMLKLDEKPGVKEQVFFFDTSDYSLNAKHLILRARQKAGHPADSIVKLRTVAGAGELSDAEKGIKPEEDWTNETSPAISRSIRNVPLPDGLLGEVDQGRWSVDKLFNGAQRQMVEARIKNFHWETLRRFGPIEAELWEHKFKLKGFPEPVTVERWHIERDGRTLHILELSAKARTDANSDTKKLVGEFFNAAEGAGLGRPGGQSKTMLVLDFFKPGR